MKLLILFLFLSIEYQHVPLKVPIPEIETIQEENLWPQEWKLLYLNLTDELIRDIGEWHRKQNKQKDNK